jgi:hypothetical protein
MLSFGRKLHIRKRKIQTPAPYDYDSEQALLDREIRAFDRRQRALIAVSANSGSPSSRAVLDEFKAADAAWRAARTECECVVDEI